MIYSYLFNQFILLIKKKIKKNKIIIKHRCPNMTCRCGAHFCYYCRHLQGETKGWCNHNRLYLMTIPITGPLLVVGVVGMLGYRIAKYTVTKVKRILNPCPHIHQGYIY